jgi:hypothetical protein
MVSLLLILNSGFSFAAAPVPIVWTGGSSPHQACFVGGFGIATVQYGFPTSFRCANSSGPTGVIRFTTPSCPTDYLVDFSKVICLPISTPWDSLVGMSLADSMQLAWLIAALWITAWIIRMLIRSLNLNSHDGDSNA